MKPVYYCRRCEAEIPRDVDECPECGYNPQSIVWTVGAIALLVGGGLLLVSPPVGLLGVFLGVIAICGSYLASPAE